MSQEKDSGQATPDRTTEERILDAAMAVFSEKGYRNATTRDIADRAHVNEVTLFRHFGSKESLFEETVQRYAPPSILTQELENELSGDVRADLTVIADRYLDAAIANTPYIKMSIMELPRNPELSRIISLIPVKLSSHVAEYLHKLYKQGSVPKADFELLAQMFYDILFHYVMSTHVFGSGHSAYMVDRKTFVATCVELFACLLAQPKKH